MSDAAGSSADTPLADTPFPVTVLSSERVFEGRVWDVRRDEIAYGDGTITRDYVDHTGAVAILALDEDERVLLIEQYRHPNGYRDWEIPAGLLDIDGEAPLAAAQRELAEEADLVAERWNLLSEIVTSPGGSNEVVRVFLARGLSATPEAFGRTEEEADLVTRWVDLDEAVAAVLSRRIANGILGFSLLAAQASRTGGWASLGPAEQPWPRHPKLRGRD